MIRFMVRHVMMPCWRVGHLLQRMFCTSIHRVAVGCLGIGAIVHIPGEGLKVTVFRLALISLMLVVNQEAVAKLLAHAAQDAATAEPATFRDVLDWISISVWGSVQLLFSAVFLAAFLAGFAAEADNPGYALLLSIQAGLSGSLVVLGAMCAVGPNLPPEERSGIFALHPSEARE